MSSGLLTHSPNLALLQRRGILLPSQAAGKEQSSNPIHAEERLSHHFPSFFSESLATNTATEKEMMQGWVQKCAKEELRVASSTTARYFSSLHTLGKFSLNSLPSTKPDHLFYDTTGFFFHLIYIYFIELSTVCNYFNLWSVENCMCLPLDCELTELHEGWNSVLHLSYLNLCPHMEPESRERTWLPPCPKPMSGIKLLLNILHGQ